MEEAKLYRPLGWTTPDESKRLVELGLSVETCDLWYAERFESAWNQNMNRYDNRGFYSRFTVLEPWAIVGTNSNKL